MHPAGLNFFFKKHMAPLAMLFVLIYPPSVWGEELWFPIYGDARDSASNLVEVRPEPIGLDQKVILEMRVSRSETRTSFRGLKYRSYYAKVVVNCNSQNAWYLWLSYFGLPLWKGEAIGREDYVEGKAPVLLKDIPGQPYKRIINAACKSKS